MCFIVFCASFQHGQQKRDYSRKYCCYCNLLSPSVKLLPLRGSGGREPGRTGAGGVWETGEERVGGGISTMAESGRKIIIIIIIIIIN